MKITDNLFRYVNIYQNRYFWTCDPDGVDLSGEHYIFCRKYNGFLLQLPPKVTEETFYQHTKLQEYIDIIGLDKEAYWALIIYIYTLHLVNYSGEYTVASSHKKQIKEIEEFITTHIDNLEIIVRSKGAKKQRPFSIIDKELIKNIFPFLQSSTINQEAKQIKEFILECTKDENTTIELIIKAKKISKANTQKISRKDFIQRLFGIEVKYNIFADGDIISINSETPKPETERIFNYFYVKELFNAVKLISGLKTFSPTLDEILDFEDDRTATTNEKYLMLYTLDFLKLHNFDDNTLFLNRQEELYYRNRLEYYNKLLIDYEGYESNCRGSFFYGLDVK